MKTTPPLVLTGIHTIVIDADRELVGSPQRPDSYEIHTASGRITYVGTSDSAPPRPPSATLVDCTGLTVSPGFVNSHNHVYEILYRGLGKQFVTEDWLRHLVYPINQALTDEDYYWGAVLASAEALRSGTTTLVEQLTNHARHHSGTEIEAFKQVGIRARVARAASTASTIDPTEESSPETEVRALTEYLEQYSDHALVKPRIGPSGLFSCDGATLRRLKDLATDADVAFHLHISESPRQQQLAESRGYEGQIAWAHSLGLLDQRTILTHAIYATPHEIDIIRDLCVPIVHCPRSNMITASGIAPIPTMLSKGIQVALGTDGPASNDSQDMISEMCAAVMVHRAASLDPHCIDARTAFRMATISGASMVEHDLGVLTEGAPADLIGIALSGNPCVEPIHDTLANLIYSGSGRDVQLTVVDGEVLYERGTFRSLDLGKALDHVNTATRQRIESAVRLDNVR